MIITHAHIQNFKSIKDSNEFEVDKDVTCLVGKNEAGKTAILQAINKLNSTEAKDANFSDLEYPRHKLNEYEETTEFAEALITKWVLEEEDFVELEGVIGPTARQIQLVKISKDYSNEKDFEFELDEKPIVEHVLSVHELIGEERTALNGSPDVAFLHKALSEVADPTQRQKTLLENLTSLFNGKTAREKVIDVLTSRIPKIALFSEYLRMPGQVSVTDIKNRQTANTLEAGHRVFLALLAMIGKSITNLEEIKEHERLIAGLEGASNRITNEIFRYWSQNRHLKVQFRFEQAMPGDTPPFNSGWILRTRIDNTRHGVTTSFDQRSAGFVWFFSFLVWFSQLKREYGDNLIILLDEPGLSLHAKAQADLLRYIEEKLAPSYQVIYTTHSPFMIDPANLLRARTVEDVVLPRTDEATPPEDLDLGTKVGSDVLSTDKDTIFPLQACLGYEITQTLFLGEHTLLVEGPSEIFYFEWFKRKLASLGRISLDKRWTICPCGGIDKIPAFLSLFAGNQLHIAIMTDLADGQKKKIRNLREIKLLRDGHVLTADTYAGQAEADVEDILGRESYVELVKQAYGLQPGQELPSVRPSTSPSRVVKEVEDHFRTLPASVKEFDHYFPSEYLMHQGLSFSLPGIDVALDRFEALFRDLNSML